MNLNLTNIRKREPEGKVFPFERIRKIIDRKDSLLQWGKPQLEALYVVKIGHKQLQLLEIQLETELDNKHDSFTIVFTIHKAIN